MSVQNRLAVHIAVNTDQPGFCVTIIDRLAKVTNVCSNRLAVGFCVTIDRPTGQGNKMSIQNRLAMAYIAIAHRPGQDFVTITD